MESIINNSRFVSPTLKKYAEQAVLTPREVQEILRLGENRVYEFLEEAPFRAEKLGGKWIIFAPSFWDWYFFGESRSSVA